MTRLPLDAAHACLVVFGITKRTREYDRWVKDDGFDLDDFLQVLVDSPYLCCLDWRCDLADELPEFAEGLAGLGIDLQFEFFEQGNSGRVACGGNMGAFSLSASDEHELDATMRTIQRVIPAGFEIRAQLGNEDMDQATYAILSKDAWAELANAAPAFIAEVFPPDRAVI